MRVYDYSNYRHFIQDKVKSRPNRGRGELLKIAKHMRLHTTTLSQILNGTRAMSPEQATAIAAYFGLNERDTRYLLLQVLHDRAGTEELKKIFHSQLSELKESSGELVHLIPHDKTLDEQDKATFYSHWYYSAIRVLSSLQGHQSPETVADFLRLPRKLTNEAIDFLVHTGLCVRQGDRIVPGPKYTHLEAGSPLAARHHANWRAKATERYPRLSPDEFAYTSPMSLSAADAAKVRELLLALAKNVNEIRDPSPSEQAYCLNLDWIRVE